MDLPMLVNTNHYKTSNYVFTVWFRLVLEETQP